MISWKDVENLSIYAHAELVILAWFKFVGLYDMAYDVC